MSAGYVVTGHLNSGRVVTVEIDRHRDALGAMKAAQDNPAIAAVTVRGDGYEIGRFVRNACEHCGGSGKAWHSHWAAGEVVSDITDCHVCEGNGYIPTGSSIAGLEPERAGEVSCQACHPGASPRERVPWLCPTCDGDGSVDCDPFRASGHQCPTCNGRGDLLPDAIEPDAFEVVS